MRTMGVRAKPGEVTLAVYDAAERALLNVEIMKIPKALSTPDSLKYLRSNILDVIQEYEIVRAGIRVTESNAQSLSIERIEIEGVIQEAFASSCLQNYYVGRIANISRRIGIRREDFKRYIQNEITFDAVDNWAELKPDAREAVFTALGAENA